MMNLAVKLMKTRVAMIDPKSSSFPWGQRPHLIGCENLNGKNDDIFGFVGIPLNLIGVDLNGLNLLNLRMKKAKQAKPNRQLNRYCWFYI